MMEDAFWRMLTTAGVVSAFLTVLLPARRRLLSRYAPQVRWGLWQGMAAVLILGIFTSGFAALPATSWHLPGYSVTFPAMAEELYTLRGSKLRYRRPRHPLPLRFRPRPLPRRSG